MMRWFFLPLLLLAACSKSSDVLEELPNSSLAGSPRGAMSETRLEAGLTRRVTIGEDGPRLDACGAMGLVTRAGEKGLVLRAAPFEEGKEVGRLANGDRAFVCTRSLDQKWLGVVVVAMGASAGASGVAIDRTDCGVSDPVDRKQPYDGPCPSGWVSSAAVRLVSH